MAVDVRLLRGLRAVIPRRHGLPARDVGHHDCESGNVDADKVPELRCVIGRAVQVKLDSVKARCWRASSLFCSADDSSSVRWLDHSSSLLIKMERFAVDCIRGEEWAQQLRRCN